ncbi:MAG: hypothetical protein AB7S97_01860 [Thermoplasmata archaeon]
MCPRGTRGAYRKEERAQLPDALQKKLVEAAARGFGTLEKLAKELEIPKSSVHYYRTGRLTLPVSVMERMLELAGDGELEDEVRGAARAKDRTWANSHAAGVYREMCRERLKLPTTLELERDDELRRKAAAIVSYVMAEGSIWVKHNRFDAGMVNITLADHETDLYEHFRSLCKDVFLYDMGPPQRPGNGARAIRGFICSRFIADWLVGQGVPQGEKSACDVRLPDWVLRSRDTGTLVAALQPWCDGEGSVAGCVSPSSFSIAQSRHTTLTGREVSYGLAHVRHGYVLKKTLSKIVVGDRTALSLCTERFRSTVLDDVGRLCALLGLSPRADVSRLHIKSDGYWSCIWLLTFDRIDTAQLLRLGAITQSRKRGRFGHI